MILYRELTGTAILWLEINRPTKIDDSDFNLYQFKIEDEVFSTPSKKFYDILEKENVWMKLRL